MPSQRKHKGIEKINLEEIKKVIFFYSFKTISTNFYINIRLFSLKFCYKNILQAILRKVNKTEGKERVSS